MKKSILLRFLNPTLIAALSLMPLLTILPVLAAPVITYNGNPIYKDSKSNVYRVTATSDVEVSYSGVEVSKSPYSDACGFTKITFVDTSASLPTAINFNGSADTVSAMPLAFKGDYKCVNGLAQWKGTARTSVFKTSNESGGVVNTAIYYPPSRTGGATKQGLITYTSNLTKKVKTNACGYVLVSTTANSQKQTSSSLSIDGSPINVANLTVNPSPPDCTNGKLSTSDGAVATYNGNSLYRTDKAIYLAGLTPRSLNVVGYDALQSKTFAIANTCGMVRMKYSEMPTSIKIGANTYTPPTMSFSSFSLFFGCESPGYAALASNTLYKVDGKDYVYKTSDLTLKRLVAENPMVVSKNIPVNACGFATIPTLNIANGFSTGDKVTINGSTPYSVTTLPLAPSEPTCRNGVIYRTN